MFLRFLELFLIAKHFYNHERTESKLSHRACRRHGASIQGTGASIGCRSCPHGHTSGLMHPADLVELGEFTFEEAIEVEVMKQPIANRMRKKKLCRGSRGHSTRG